MKWVSHIGIGASSAAIISPVLAPAAALGATAPDWLEWVLKATGIHVKHRRETHYFIIWLIVWIGLVIVPIDSMIILHLAAFAWGGLTHILTDATTVQGVPFAPSSGRNFHLFGGRIRTGSVTEYIVAAGLSIGFLLIASQTFKAQSGGFMPYFYDWSGAYETGKIDAYEWKTNRWKFI